MSKHIIFLYFIALVIRIIFAVPLIHDWDGFVFSESAKNLLKGETPYQTVVKNNPEIYPDSDKPMVQMWYAYPPLPLLMFTSPLAITTILRIPLSPLAEIFLLKLPFIAGDLLAAYLVWKFLEQKDKKLARKAELLILFNPLLIWVSSAWGMFDIWIVNFILLFLLALRSKRVVLAGIFLACAPLVKLFPVFFLPAVLLYTMQVLPESKKKLAFFISFILTVTVIVMPFFLSSPQGFLNQNLIMHWYRPPQGIGLIAMLDFIGHIYRFSITPIVAIASIFTLLTMLLFNILSSVYVKGQESRLLTIILLIYTSTLAFNKVVNEQYFVVFVALLIVITHLRKDEIVLFSKRFLGIAEAIVTFSVLFAGVVLGFHFLTFLPPFLSTNYLNASTNVLVFYLSKLIPQLPLYAYPNSLWTYYNAPVAITYIVLIPVIIICFYIVLKGYLQFFRSYREIISSLRSWATLPSFELTNVAVFLISLITTIMLSIPTLMFLNNNNALKLVDLVDAKEQVVFPSNPRVGTFYNVWWNNPSHQKDLADDAWSKTTLTPEIGYYTSKNSLFVHHIEQMKKANIDFAVVSYHLYDRERYLTFGNYAEKLGLYYAPLVETGDAVFDTKLHGVNSKGDKMLEFAINPEAKEAVKTYVLSSIADNYKSPALLRIDGKPVIFVYDGHWFFPSWDKDSKERLAKRIIESYIEKGREDPFKELSKVWNISINSID